MIKSALIIVKSTFFFEEEMVVVGRKEGRGRWTAKGAPTFEGNELVHLQKEERRRDAASCDEGDCIEKHYIINN